MPLTVQLSKTLRPPFEFISKVDESAKLSLFAKIERYIVYEKVSEYDQEIPQSHTADQPTAP